MILFGLRVGGEGLEHPSRAEYASSELHVRFVVSNAGGSAADGPCGPPHILMCTLTHSMWNELWAEKARCKARSSRFSLRGCVTLNM